jgi:transcriptional regulator with XRE-family HTH domain
MEQRPAMVSRQLSNEERRHYSSLIEDLAQRRKQLRLSQEALDHKLGVSHGMVAKWETLARLPGAFFLMCWCKALNVTLTVAHEEK